MKPGRILKCDSCDAELVIYNEPKGILQSQAWEGWHISFEPVGCGRVYCPKCYVETVYILACVREAPRDTAISYSAHTHPLGVVRNLSQEVGSNEAHQSEVV